VRQRLFAKHARQEFLLKGVFNRCFGEKLAFIDVGTRHSLAWAVEEE
jgi:hypothetical protein